VCEPKITTKIESPFTNYFSLSLTAIESFSQTLINEKKKKKIEVQLGVAKYVQTH
jgi:short-subunit dehydrogenase